MQWFLTTGTSQTRSYSEDKDFQKEYTAALLILSCLLLQHYLYLNSSDSEKIKHTCLTWEKLLVHSVLDKTIPKGGKPNIIFFFSSFFNFLLLSLLPRKKCLLLNNIFLMAGALLAVTSRAAKSFEMIIISRVLVGINAGVCLSWSTSVFFYCRH